MKTLTRTALVLLFAASLTACVQDSNPKENEEPNPTCEGTECEPEPELHPVMKGAYVSAHLGSYWSCPEDGYQGAGLEPPADVPEGERASGVAAEDCDPDAGSCGTPLNCEDGQFTLRLTNSGSVTAVGVSVAKLELFNSSGSVATLPVGEVIDTETGQAFDGEVAEGETLTLRIDFMGPADPYTMLQNEQTADLEVTIESDNHDAIKIMGTDIAGVPQVAT